jgi:hypothetical protein
MLISQLHMQFQIKSIQESFGKIRAALDSSARHGPAWHGSALIGTDWLGGIIEISGRHGRYHLLLVVVGCNCPTKKNTK